MIPINIKSGALIKKLNHALRVLLNSNSREERINAVCIYFYKIYIYNNLAK